MYALLKRIILFIVPRKALTKNEKFFRSLYAQFYVGRNVQCTICKRKFRHFLDTHNDQMCPGCGSLQRTRRLWQLLDNEFLKDHQRVLDFSPSRSIYRLMKKRNIQYVSSDLSGDFISDESFDITAIATESESFDLIICYHILEHIDNDLKAMSELHRVLKKNACCLIQTPFKEGDMYEDASITAPEQREVHFGQSDHVRIYSIEGLKKRLEETGFQVEIRTFSEEENNYHGFNKHETVLICKKD